MNDERCRGKPVLTELRATWDVASLQDSRVVSLGISICPVELFSTGSKISAKIDHFWRAGPAHVVVVGTRAESKWTRNQRAAAESSATPTRPDKMTYFRNMVLFMLSMQRQKIVHT